MKAFTIFGKCVQFSAFRSELLSFDIKKESRCKIGIVVTRVELSTEMDEYRDNRDTLVWLWAGGGGGTRGPT